MFSTHFSSNCLNLWSMVYVIVLLFLWVLVHVDIWLTTYVSHVDKRGHLIDHVSTSSCPCNFWTTPWGQAVKFVILVFLQKLISNLNFVYISPLWRNLTLFSKLFYLKNFLHQGQTVYFSIYFFYHNQCQIQIMS